MHTQPNRAPRGSTMVVALGGIVIASLTLIALLESSGSSQQSTNQFIEDQGVYYAAQGATDLAISEVWGAYKQQLSSNPSLDFQTYLNGRFAFETVAPGADPLADQFRFNGGDVRRAAVSDWSSLKLGSRIVSKLCIYTRERDDKFPGTNVTKQLNCDVMIAAESQKDLGYATAQEQTASLNSSTNAVSVMTNTANANWVAQYLTVSNPPAYKGLEFGLLTKNAQCTLCHLRVSSAAKAFNKDPSKFNTFPRVKVGSTGMLALNSGSDTVVEGALYQRGSLEDDMSASLLDTNSAASRLMSVALNSNGTIKQDGSGNTTPIVCTASQTSTSGGQTIAPPVNGNFYPNYPTDTSMQSDGVVPNNDFPSAFPDLPRAADLNRPNHKVDSDEVAMAMTDAVAASDPNQPGSVTGGVAVMLAPGTQYTQTVLPNTGTAASISQGFSGNVILTGTVDNPIKLDGKVVIDGDVIIRGYVQGTGQIFASGNIYIPGDVIYKDRTDSITVTSGSNTTTVSQEAFGADSQNKQNLLGLVAGKNIVVGDYLSQVTNWNEGDTTTVGSANRDFYAPRFQDPTTGQVVTKKGQPEPGKILTYQNDGYLNPAQVTVLPGTTTIDGQTYSNYSQPNFTMFQLAQFNQSEYVRTLLKLPDYSSSNTYDPTNPDHYRVDNTPANNPGAPYDDSYIPRYYSFYSYDASNPKNNPVYVTTTGWQQSPEVGGNGAPFSTDEQRFQLERHSADPVNFTDLSDIPASVQSQAALNKKTVINVHPDWVTPDTMMQIISSEELTRQSDTRRIDGLLYTNNAVLATERPLVQVYDPTSGKWHRALSKGSGNLTINGAVVAPDLGVMTPKGTFTVNYDQRVQNLVKLQSSAPTSGFSPAGWDMQRRGFTKNAGPMPTAATAVLNAGAATGP
ncbi:MAG TPA: hypothetical protein VKX17_20015 [Planctomycetota bacterium]|nr:hypothetical protein [Planctomycetota bacterium]